MKKIFIMLWIFNFILFISLLKYINNDESIINLFYNTILSIITLSFIPVILMTIIDFKNNFKKKMCIVTHFLIINGHITTGKYLHNIKFL